MGLFIKNGMLVTSEKTFSADILIENGKISRIEKPGTVSVLPDKVIDALGMLVFPGGIDPHVHMHLPTPAGFSSDDFLSGSRAALFGGTTTLIDFVTPHKGENLCKALEKRKAEAENCFTDYAFHVSPVEWRPSLPEEIRACIKSGTPSFKVYMAYKDSIGLEDEALQKVFQVVAEAGGMVTAHCELGDEIENLRNDFVKNGRTTPEYHPLSRPARLEADAIKKALGFARQADCPFYIVHVSAAASLVPIRQAQKRGGQRVFAESCPHYLLLDDSRYQGNFQQTAPFVLSPPLRKKADNRALWEALADGTIQSMGTDHCPFTMEQKRNGLHDFRKIANGAGSVEHRLTLLYTYGVLRNRISLNRFVELTSTQPAKIFGLYPQKGALLPGSDADIVIWNPEKEQIISAPSHHMHCDTDIYEGFKIKGAPEYVIARGKIAIERDNWTGSLSSGRFLKRKI